MTLDTFRYEITWRLRHTKELLQNSFDGTKMLPEIGYWKGYAQAMTEVDILLANVVADTEEEKE